MTLIATLLVAMPTRGAEFFYMDRDAFTDRYIGAVGPLVLSGDILQGDYDRLLSKIAADPERFLTLNQMLLASIAGDGREAMRIAGLLKLLHSRVIVTPLTGRCSGPCFLIYAAAAERGTDGEHLIGFSRSSQEDAAVRDFMRDNEVPDQLTAQMLHRPADELYWLSAEDEATLKYKSPAFDRYLVAKCGWDDAVERQVNTGARPGSDMAPMWACRRRITGIDARKALATLRNSGPASPRAVP